MQGLPGRMASSEPLGAAAKPERLDQRRACSASLTPSHPAASLRQVDLSYEACRYPARC